MPNRKPIKIPQGTPLQIDKSLANPLECSCGCKNFTFVQQFFNVSGLANPTGEDIIFPEERWMCVHCKNTYRVNELKTEREYKSLKELEKKGV